MFNFPLRRIFLIAFCLTSLTACNAATDSAELKALETKLAAAQTEVAELKTEIATLQSRQVGIDCGKGNDALLTQSGDLSALLGVGETDIFYPKPYASPPELILQLSLVIWAHSW
jgi:hypothetical protein